MTLQQCWVGLQYFQGCQRGIRAECSELLRMIVPDDPTALQLPLQTGPAQRSAMRRENPSVVLTRRAEPGSGLLVLGCWHIQRVACCHVLATGQKFSATASSTNQHAHTLSIQTPRLAYVLLYGGCSAIFCTLVPPDVCIMRSTSCLSREANMVVDLADQAEVVHNNTTSVPSHALEVLQSA